MNTQAFMILFYRAIKILTERPFFAVFFLSVVFATLQGCKNDDTNLGLDLLPTNGQINAQLADTFSIFSWSVPADSVQTDNLSTSIVGALNDPEFGVSASNLYMQLLLPEINLNFGTSPVLDSCVLVLQYGNQPWYGNISSTQKLNVYRVAEDLKADNAYYHNTPIALAEKIGTWQGTFSPKDSVRLVEKGDTLVYPPELRIRLNASFANELLNASPSVYGSNTAFLQYLKGIALVPATGSIAPGNGAIVNLNLLGAYSQMELYYNDSMVKSFTITGESERIMTYSHPQINSNLQAQFNSPGVAQQKSYVQTMAGAKTRIVVPHLKNLVADGRKIIIQEASITFYPVAGSVSTTYPAPERFLLFQPDSVTGKNASILDLVDYLAPPPSWRGYTTYGGSWDVASNSVTFRFTRHLQKVLEHYLQTGQDINNGFYLTIPSDYPITPSRFFMDNQKTRIKIIYTKL